MLVMEAERFGGPQVLTARQMPDPVARAPNRSRVLGRSRAPPITAPTHPITAPTHPSRRIC